MNKIVINGKEIECNGNNICIKNNEIYIDGISVAEANDNSTVYIYGDVGSIECKGSVNCNNVKGNVKASGSVNCDDISGNVNCGGSVNCDAIGGDITAGGNINYQ